MIHLFRKWKKTVKREPDTPRELTNRVDRLDRQVTYLETQVKLLERVQS
jgi:hypothetical protein